MVTMNDIIAFVEKAMKQNLYIYNYCEGTVIKKNNNKVDISKSINGKDIIITTKSGRFRIKNLTEKEILQYNLLRENVKSYMEDRGIEEFENFFKDEENKVKDINDLDNEDE